MYIFISILIFGILIAIHELGHFLAARIFGVNVPEFAIGMGPVLFRRQGKRETLFTLRAIPIGGFCALEDEDSGGSPGRRADTDEADIDTTAAIPGEGSIMQKPLWQRLIIFLAGPLLNLIAAFIVLVALFSTITHIPTTQIESLVPDFPLYGEAGLMPGDSFHRINGERVYHHANVAMLLSLSTDGTQDIVVIRDGQRVVLENLPLQPQIFEGYDMPRYGINFAVNDSPTIGDRLAHSLSTTRDFARQLRLTVRLFASGQAGVRDISSVVGIVHVMNQVGQTAETVGLAVQRLAMLTALISVSLAVMNLLPIPGLDGGRIFLMIFTWLIEKITRRKLNPKYEGYINTVGVALLLCFMAVIVFMDVVQIITG